MRIAMAQMSMTNNIDENFDRTLEYVEKAKEADLLFFPEIQLTPFFPQYKEEELKEAIGFEKEELSLSIDGIKVNMLRDLCKDFGLWMSPNIYIKEDDKFYDMSLMIDDNGEIIDTSKMVHIHQAENFYEKDYYTPSEEGFIVYNTPFGKIGVVICYDRHFPESIRTCALMGAKLIIIPTANTVAEPMDMFEWELRVAAYQNNVYIAMCNRVGTEGNMEFAGESIIVDSNGNVVFKADNNEQLIIKEIDLDTTDTSRAERPFIEELRPDFYVV